MCKGLIVTVNGNLLIVHYLPGTIMCYFEGIEN